MNVPSISEINKQKKIQTYKIQYYNKKHNKIQYTSKYYGIV